MLHMLIRRLGTLLSKHKKTRCNTHSPHNFSSTQYTMQPFWMSPLKSITYFLWFPSLIWHPRTWLITNGELSLLFPFSQSPLRSITNDQTCPAISHHPSTILNSIQPKDSFKASLHPARGSMWTRSTITASTDRCQLPLKPFPGSLASSTCFE